MKTQDPVYAPGAVLLLGPTGCGKSALAMDIAQASAAEIVSVDSVQVYRGMDIGTAKPDVEERVRVPHHLLDLRDPAETYSAADFARDTQALLPSIARRGRLALLAGGTMLYAKALNEGLADLPAADAGVRAVLSLRARSLGWPALHAELAQCDPQTAARLAPNDGQRIQRALEVWQITGRPLSAMLAGAAGERPMAPPIASIVLLPQDREALNRRLEARFDAMLAAGFVDEVRALVARGDLHPDLPSQRSVGYRQAWTYLAGGCSSAEFREAAIAATRRLAKRQFTWLRTWPAAARIDPFQPDAKAAVRSAVRALAGGGPVG